MKFILSFLAILGTCLFGAACSSETADEPPVASVSVSANKPRAPLGSPVEITYRFVVAANAPALDQDYSVFVHFMDADDELMWADDHEPSVPTRQWKPGQTIEYTRTTFMAKYPYVGAASIDVGLYSIKDQRRLTLSAESHQGLKAYRVAKIELLPQSESIFIVYKDGWHRAEVSPENPGLEWQWTKRDAVLAFRNPKRDSLFYMRLEGRPEVFSTPQQVTVLCGETPVDSFIIASKGEIIRKIPLTAAQLGPAEQAELQIRVDQTFVPSAVRGGNPDDARELGVRVFNAYVAPI